MFRHFCDYPILKYVSSLSEIGGVVEADGGGGVVEADGGGGLTCTVWGGLEAVPGGV